MPWLLLVLSLFSFSVQAGTEPFTRQSLENLLTQKQGQAFVLAFWSLDCSYCRKEMQYFGQELTQKNHFDLVLVATDDIEQKKQIEQRLADLKLSQVPSLAFAENEDRLRFAIDQDWYGELPRTYFFNKDGSVSAKSGMLNEGEFKAWQKANL